MMETDIAWLAGLIDGEGSFKIRKQTRDRGRDVAWYKPMIEVTMAGLAGKCAVDHIQDITSRGSVCQRTRKTNAGKDVWCWTVVSRDAVEIACTILPYLIVKHEQARLVIALGHSLAQRRWGNTNPVSTDDLAKREHYRVSLMLCNHC